MKVWIWVIILVFFLAGCEDTNLDLATKAGVDAVRAVTLSDDQVRLLAGKAARISDQRHRVAGANTPYARRLETLTKDMWTDGKTRFNIKVYLDPQVNAFAMADGSIRLYSGLMDRMDNPELLFVIGHEAGHVVEKHSKKKMMVALAASALRKGIASQENMAGLIASSALGGLAQELANAQFSQQEERAADSYGLGFLKRNGIPETRAVNTAARALEKLARASGNHSLLSSHPSPEKRAKRIRSGGLGSGEKREEQALTDRLRHQGMIWFDMLKNLITGRKPQNDTGS